MKRASTLTVCLSILGLMTACSPKPAQQVQQELDNTPDWYMNPHQPIMTNFSMSFLPVFHLVAR